MTKARNLLKLLVFSSLLAIAGAGAGCVGADPPDAYACTARDGAAFKSCRTFHGRLRLPHPSDLRLETRALQVAAIGFRATTSPSTADGGASGGATNKVTYLYFSGPTFAAEAGAGQQATLPFALAVPCNLTVNLLLQTPRDGAGAVPGVMLAPMTFDDGSGNTTTTLVPPQQDDACGEKTNAWDLGIVDLVLTKSTPITGATVTLGKGNSKSPLSLIDSDGDGTPDAADSDDDDDGKSDAFDTDVQGDGILDKAQTLSALPDQNKDGVADLLQ